jgi:ATP-binding cassette, subfamily B, multidrug efflux pump
MPSTNNTREDRNFIPLPRNGHRRPGMPVEKPKNFKRTMKRLWGFFGHENKLLTLILIFVMVDSAILLAVPYLTGRAVDFMSGGKNAVLFNQVRSVIFLLLAVFLSDLFLTFFNNFLMAGVSQRIVKVLRKSLFTKLQRMPISYFDRHTHGDLMSRFTNDIDNISTTISSSTVSLMTDVISILGSFLMMLLLNPLLTLASVIIVPLVLLLSKMVTKHTSQLFRKQQNILGRLNGHIEESISGLQVVKAFNHENEVIDDFSKINAELFSVGLKAQIISGYLMPLMNIINNIGFVMVAVVGGVLAVGGAITVGVIASFLSYTKQFSRPLNDVANVYNTLQTAIAGAERIFEVLDDAEESADDPHATEVIKPKGNLEFQNVTFGYREDLAILKNVSFKVPEGCTVALVGPTGAGKTTIASLVNRFYDINSGRILLDGNDITSFTRESLRKCFGIVLQDTYLFSGTIAENIRYGRLDATDSEIKSAAAKAGADSFIEKLENGYNTVLSESGKNLSQGQRQLLAIARAVLASPSILILDEATSSVDTRTEMLIQQAMAELMRDRTCFIIAHRLSTIKDADLIMVISGGNIVERGNHESLIEQKGFYYNLYQSQFNNIPI